MATRLVNPGDPSIERVEQKLPVLPRAEAHRIRRASRGYFDILLPEAMRVVADMLVDEDPKNKMWAADRVLKAVLATQPNEMVDPESATVDSSGKTVEALSDLEKDTENGTGLPEEDK